MKLTKMKIKLFGKTEVLFRVLDENGEVIKVAETEQEAQEWMSAQ